MPRILFTSLVLAFSFQPACAERAALIEDVAPTAQPKWACPSSVTVGNVEHRQTPGIGVYDGPPEERAAWAPEPRRFIQHHPGGTDNIYIACYYEALEPPLIIHAKGATHCGKGGKPLAYGCWDGPSPPPYNRGDPRLQQ